MNEGAPRNWKSRLGETVQAVGRGAKRGAEQVGKVAKKTGERIAKGARAVTEGAGKGPMFLKAMQWPTGRNNRRRIQREGGRDGGFAENMHDIEEILKDSVYTTLHVLRKRTDTAALSRIEASGIDFAKFQHRLPSEESPEYLALLKYAAGEINSQYQRGLDAHAAAPHGPWSADVRRARKERQKLNAVAQRRDLLMRKMEALSPKPAEGTKQLV